MRPTFPRRAILPCLIGLSCSACLILDPVDFPPRENHPARIVDQSTVPDLSGYTYISRQELEPRTFRLTVVDEDLEDAPDARAFVDFEEGDPSAVFPLIEDVAGDDTKRLVTVQFKPDFFSPGCHVLEIDVVDNRSAWVGVRDVNPAAEKDRAVWWLRAYDGEDPTNIPDELCRPTSAAGGQSVSPP